MKGKRTLMLTTLPYQQKRLKEAALMHKQERFWTAMHKLGLSYAHMKVETYRVNSPGQAESSSVIQLTHRPTGWQVQSFRYRSRVDNLLVAGVLLYAAVHGLIDESWGRQFGPFNVRLRI